MDFSFLKCWYRNFPRQLFIYRLWVNNFQELKTQLESRFNEKDIYASVYSYPTRDLSKPLFNKLVFDFDYEKKNLSESELKEAISSVFEDVKKLCNFFDSKDIKYHVFYTGGRGFHVYVFFNPLKVKKSSVREFALKLKTMLNLKYYDEKITYDFARMIRIPFTLHSSGRYCIPVTSLDIDVDEIISNSKNPEFEELIPVENRSSKILLLMEEVVNFSAYNSEASSHEFEELASYGKKYMTAPCINALFSNKLPAGNRWNKASKFIAIAYYLDHNGNMDGFEDVVKLFVVRQNVDHPLKLKEVLGWKRGVYKLKGPEWNCKEIIKYLRSCGIKINCRNCVIYKLKLKEKERRQKLEMLNLVEKLKKISILEEVKKHLDKKVVGEDKLKVLLYLLTLAKQNVVIKGEFASGKNTIVDAVLDLFPQDYVMAISSYTQKILRWLDTDEIKILYLKELPPEVLSKAGQLKDFTFDLKLAMSDKVLEIWYVDRVDGELETKKREIRVDTVIQTTPSLDMPEDYKSRVWILSTDPSEDQTEKVLLHKARMRKYIDEEDILLTKEEIRKISAFLFNIKLPVYIPFAESIARSVRLRSTKMRREIDKLYDLISTITKIRFPDRLYKYKSKFILVSSIEDFILSRVLFEEYMQLSILDLEKRFTIAIDAFNEIARHRGQVTVSDFASKLSISKTKAKEILEILCDRGLIERLPEVKDVYVSSSIEIDFTIFRDIDEKELENEAKEWIERYSIKKADLKEFLLQR